MYYRSTLVLAITLILTSLLSVAAPIPADEVAARRALKQYKMKRGDAVGRAQAEADHPRPSHKPYKREEAHHPKPSKGPYYKRDEAHHPKPSKGPYYKREEAHHPKPSKGYHNYLV